MITSTGAVSNLLRPAVVRFEATNGTPPPNSHNRPPPSPPPPSTPLLSLPKPSWIVRTECNVRLEKRRKPEPSCVVCRGSGRVDCYDCCGKGRRNNVDLAMLPNGEWPKWCKTCGGSGLAYCSRCLGTGEYRYLMGFHFMKRNEDKALSRDGENYKMGFSLCLIAYLSISGSSRHRLTAHTPIPISSPTYPIRPYPFLHPLTPYREYCTLQPYA